MTPKGKDHMWKIALLLAIVMSATNSAHADWVECNDCRAIAGSELELTRGGYLGGDGLEVSFGIEKAVFINGILQATSTLNVPLLGADSGQSLSDLQSQRMVVQNGLVIPSIFPVARAACLHSSRTASILPQSRTLLA